MRGVCSILISYVLFYIALNIKSKYSTFRAVLTLLSFAMIVASIVLMIFGV